ncbi:MAG: carbohydrate kinase [Clostridia bacterium]|nr:carbohydrate kinase [Clostridia bacterium]
MKKSFDVIALGELLVDFSGAGRSAQDNMLFEANPGGAPCNVLAMLAKLGKKTAFIGKVGQDFLGNMLKDKVQSLGIDTTCLYADNSVPTTLAFIHNAPDGEREFSFYREPGADTMLCEQEISEEMIAGSKIFHYGTLSMTHSSAAAATERAVALAQKHGLLLSFDPNLRFNLWQNEDVLAQAVSFGLTHCDILKISADELCWFTKESDLQTAVKRLRAQYAISLIVVTDGKNGSDAYYQDIAVHTEAFLRTDTVDTTGAGDTFCGCLLNGILENGGSDLNRERLTKMMRFASAASALITTKKGALCVMPDGDAIRKLLRNRNSDEEIKK